jgi:hypothetical protein
MLLVSPRAISLGKLFESLRLVQSITVIQLLEKQVAELTEKSKEQKLFDK